MRTQKSRARGPAPQSPPQTTKASVEANPIDARIRELVATFPATSRRHVQRPEGDWLPCYRDYRYIPKGEEVLVYLPVSETTGEWTVVAYCSECWRTER